MKTIGVLGGMGPQATVLLMQRLIAGIDADDDAAHLPLLVDLNTQVPSRLDWLLNGKGEDPGPVLAGMAHRLERAGAEALVMPCNTAHNFASQIRSAVDIPFLHMVDLTAAHIAGRFEAGASVGVLASPAARQTHLFMEAFSAHGLVVTLPSSDHELLSAIRRIKSHGVSQRDRDVLALASEDCQRQGAACIVLGCSEFSLLADTLHVDLPVVDTVQVLVEAMYTFAELDRALRLPVG